MQDELYHLYCPGMNLSRRTYSGFIKIVTIALICLQVLYYLNLPLPHELYLNAQGWDRRSYKNTIAFSWRKTKKYIYDNKKNIS